MTDEEKLALAEEKQDKIKSEIVNMEDGKHFGYGAADVAALRLRLHAVLMVIRQIKSPGAEFPF